MADREKVLRWLAICGENMDCSECCPYLEKKYKDPVECMSALMRDALELLKKQPEQKHGHWISLGDAHYTCSCCRTPRHMNFVPNYCSECGARMDEEVKQE